MPCRGLVTKQTYAVRSWQFINVEVAFLFDYTVFKGVTYINFCYKDLLLTIQ